MARRRFKQAYKKVRRYKTDKGLLHEIKLNFTSKSRRKAMIQGLVVAPLLFAVPMYSKYGAWITAKASELTSKMRGS